MTRSRPTSSPSRLRFAGLTAVLMAVGITMSPAAPASASTETLPLGKVSGLPLPRYASLKTDRVNLRQGPSKDYRTNWVFQRAGMPVEIVAEYETWRRIRDAEGTEGWVLHSLLSGRRTAVVMPWAKPGAKPLPLLDDSRDKAPIVAELQPNVIASVKQCTGGWCRIVIPRSGTDVSGYIKQDILWGVYPDEKVE